MKVVLPLARIENAYKRVDEYDPLTLVAGKPVIGHLVDQVSSLHPKEIIFIVGDHEDDVVSYLKKNCKYTCKFIKQKFVRGSAHAIYGARKYVDGDILILFSDTFFDQGSLKDFRTKKADGVIWVSEVEDPTELGIVFMDGKYASKLIEKPDAPVSNLVMIGLYYFRDAKKLFDGIKYLLDNDIKTKGEFQLTDAIQVMINRGFKVATRKAKEWLDSDCEGGLLDACGWLCAQNSKNSGRIINSAIIKPVFIDKGVIVENSIVGPNVSIASGSHVKDSIVHNSVIGRNANLVNALLSRSIIGSGARVSGNFQQLNIADQKK